MKLDTRITLQRAAESISASGSVASVPETIGEVWANVSAGGSREADKMAEQSVIFTVRASPSTLKLEPRDRVTWKGKAYAVSGVQAIPEARPVWVKITAATSQDSVAA